MIGYKALYPELARFFGGYFHQDWQIPYEQRGEKPKFQTVVYEFKTTVPESIMAQTRYELERFLYAVEHGSLTEIDLHEILETNFHSSVYAPGLGMTFRQWLDAILEIFNE